jgi:hypothetical protein
MERFYFEAEYDLLPAIARIIHKYELVFEVDQHNTDVVSVQIPHTPDQEDIISLIEKELDALDQ